MCGYRWILLHHFCVVVYSHIQCFFIMLAHVTDDSVSVVVNSLPSLLCCNQCFFIMLAHVTDSLSLLQVGMMLLSVDGQTVVGSSHAEAQSLLNKSYSNKNGAQMRLQLKY